MEVPFPTEGVAFHEASYQDAGLARDRAVDRRRRARVVRWAHRAAGALALPGKLLRKLDGRGASPGEPSAAANLERHAHVGPLGYHGHAAVAAGAGAPELLVPSCQRGGASGTGGPRG